MNIKSKITVIGSSNTDMVVMTSHFPAPSETILGGESLMNAGSKGANQAVAAAKCGGEVFLSGKSSRMRRRTPTRSLHGCLFSSSPD